VQKKKTTGEKKNYGGDSVQKKKRQLHQFSVAGGRCGSTMYLQKKHTHKKKLAISVLTLRTSK